VTELLKLLASENCCSLPLMLNLMYICEILRATVLYTFFEISLSHFEIN